MVKQVNAINNYSSYSNTQNPPLDFGTANIPEQPNDSFVSTTKPVDSSQKTLFAWVEGISATVAAGSLALFARGRIKTNEVMKIVNDTLTLAGEKSTKSLKEGVEKLGEIATKDSLSGMNNRRTFDAALKKTLNKTFNKAVASKKNIHAAILDMDYFKSINDVLGHDIGDEFIQNLGKNIDEVTKKHNLKGYRYGGEEFAVLMPGHDSESSQKIIQEIADKIKSDKNIQKYRSKFLNTAKKQLDEFERDQKKFNKFWDSLREDKNQSKLAKETLKWIGDNPESKEYQGILNKAIVELKKIAENKSPKNVFDVVTNHHTTDEGKGILATLLNQKHNKKEEIAARIKWIKHVTDNKGFTVSAGISKNLPDDDAKKFFKRADENLAKAKANGRNTVLMA